MKKILLILLCLPLFGLGQTFLTVNTQDGGPWELYWEIQDSTGFVWHSDSVNGSWTTVTTPIFLPNTCTAYDLVLYDSNGGGWCSMGCADLAITQNSDTVFNLTAYNINALGGNWLQTTVVLNYGCSGCTDVNALNYDSIASIDDGSCIYQKTYVPDDIFEVYLEMNGMGDGIILNDSVFTQNIKDITYLNVESSYMTDLTGIEDFLSLYNFQCGGNQLTSLDLSQNTDLTYLYCNDNQLTSLDVTANLNLIQFQCGNNQLTSLDISNNTTLQSFGCYNNQLTSLDVSTNTALTELWCHGNQLTSLDVSQNTALTWLDCYNNQLTSLDFRNINILNCYLNSYGNQNLYCIDVDNVALANILYAGAAPTVDSLTSFSTNCATALGCTDPLALNYNSLATIDDGSCIYPGCMDSVACNYDPSSPIDDGSCVYSSLDTIVVSTCMSDPQAPNEYYFSRWNSFYGWHYDVLTQSGIYTALYPGNVTMSGCDSTIILDLTISNTSSSSTSITSCDPYTWTVDGITYTSSGTYTNVYTNAAGCDSTHTLELFIADLCGCDTVYYYADEWMVPGSFQYTTTSGTFQYSTDSLGNPYYVDIIVNYSTSSTTNITTCDAYTWLEDGNTYITSGTYYSWLGTNVAGCDSTAILNLTINSSTSNSTTITDCDSYAWPVSGMTYSSSGTYYFASTNAVSCADTSWLYLTINNSTSNSTTATACDTYTWSVDGNAYTTSGSYVYFSTNAAGCAHTETLELTIYPKYWPEDNSTDTTVFCSYTWPVNGQTYYSSVGLGTVYHTDLSMHGCDSMSQLNLTIDTVVYNTTTTITACDEYDWYPSSNSYNYTSSGTYISIDSSPWSGQCHQVDTLILTIISSTSNSTLVTACDTYTWPVDGNTYTTSGTYTAVNGCHTETLELTINNSTSNSTITTACDSYTWSVDGNTYTTSGTYTAVNGCHTETLELTITSSSSNTTTITACDSYTWSAVDGDTYTTSGTYTYAHPLPPFNGCHTEILELTINSSTSNSTTITACDSYTWSVDGSTYTSSGTYTDVSTNSNGCEHTETLNLTINSSTSNSTSVTACDTYTWLVDGNTYTASGTYIDTVAVPTPGCNHIEILELTINSSTSNSTSATACDTYTWNGTEYTSSGTYTDVSTNSNGCNHTETLTLEISGVSTVSAVTECDSYTWNGTEYTSSGTYTSGGDCNDTLLLTINNSTTSTTTETACESYTWNGTDYTTGGAYTYVTTNNLGCTHTETLNLEISGVSTVSVVTECESYTWNGTDYTTSGIYTSEGSSCVDTLDLTINTVIASIDQDGDNLDAITTPVGLNADWYNIQGERIWLMEEDAATFTPTFECYYFIVVDNQGTCADTSDTYYFGATAKRIGSLVTSPNPTRGLINVKFENTKNQFVYVHLMNGNGVKLDDFITKNTELDIDITKYPSGTYYLYFNGTDAKQGCNPEDVEIISTKIILNK